MASPAAHVARSYHRVAASHRERFRLGVGIGRPEAAERTAHVDPGADHVAAQFLHADGADPVPAMRGVAAAPRPDR